MKRPDDKRRDADDKRRQVIEQLGEFPPELARCTCNTPSLNRDDHANRCPLGPTPPLSCNPNRRPPTRDLPEERF